MAERGRPDPREAEPGDALRATQSLAFLVGMSLCLALSLSFAMETFGRGERALVITLGERVNPNEAPPASLMRLPQIGAARARVIVSHRDRAGAQGGRTPVFRKADDLQQIKGFGPAVVEDLRPWLQFDSSLSDSNESPLR